MPARNKAGAPGSASRDDPPRRRRREGRKSSKAEKPAPATRQRTGHREPVPRSVGGKRSSIAEERNPERPAANAAYATHKKGLVGAQLPKPPCRSGAAQPARIHLCRALSLRACAPLFTDAWPSAALAESPPRRRGRGCRRPMCIKVQRAAAAARRPRARSQPDLPTSPQWQ